MFIAKTSEFTDLNSTIFHQIIYSSVTYQNLLLERSFQVKATLPGTSGKDIRIYNKGNIYNLCLTGGGYVRPLIREYNYIIVKPGSEGIFLNSKMLVVWL